MLIKLKILIFFHRIVESPQSSSEKTVKNVKNKKRANKEVPLVLNAEPIEIKESVCPI